MASSLISIIIPVYNTEKYLDRCIQSVLAQTYTNWELLLIDDGSTDSSGIICDKYAAHDNRIRVFHKPNGGVSSARNLGLDNAKGEWISFVDADDWIENSMLYDAHQKAIDENAEIIFTDIKYHYLDIKKNAIYETFRWGGGRPKEALKNYLKETRNCPGWALIKYSLINDTLCRFPENITIYEDFHLLIRLVFQAIKVSNIKRPLYNYRMQEESIVHTNPHSRTIRNQEWAYNSILEYFKLNGVYRDYAPALYGRVLHDYQRMVLDVSLHEDFVTIYPDKKHFIWSCSSINLKLKVMMWCLTHHLSFITYLFVKARKLLNRV